MFPWYQILFSNMIFWPLAIAIISGIVWLVQRIRKKQSKAGYVVMIALIVMGAGILAYALSASRAPAMDIRKTQTVTTIMETDIATTTSKPESESPSTAEPETIATETETERETSATETEEVSTAVYTASAESLERLAVELFDFEYSDLQVEWDDFNNAFSVTYLPAYISDETAFVRQNVNRYIHFCKYAYQIEGLERVRFDVLLAGMDQYGNDMVIEGMSEFMERETFEKFNWENLEYMNIWESFANNCAYIGIDPVIGRELDESKIFYDPFLRDGKIT